MNRLIRVRKIAHQKDKGFVTFEIIISILIALAFVAVSMQSLVYAMAMKVQAQEKQRANQLIQEDIERMNQLGGTALTPTTVADPIPVCDPVATPADATTTPSTPAYTPYQNSYANALWTAVNATGTQTKNLLEKIDTSTGAVDTSGKQLALQRFHISGATNNSTFPHRTLKVRYQVWEWNGSNYIASDGSSPSTGDEPIAETYVEVIPDVALACP